MKFNGSAVATRRCELGMRPEALAVAIGRSASSVYLYERGAVEPPISVASRIAEVLGMEVADIFTVTDRVSA